jgi:hypothetical protein
MAQGQEESPTPEGSQLGARGLSSAQEKEVLTRRREAVDWAILDDSGT